MRIDEFKPHDQKIRRTDSQATREYRASAESGALSGDHVALSNLSQALLGFSPQPARVARLQAEVQSGTYHIAADQISRRLIAEVAGN